MAQYARHICLADTAAEVCMHVGVDGTRGGRGVGCAGAPAHAGSQPGQQLVMRGGFIYIQDAAFAFDLSPHFAIILKHRIRFI